MRQLTIALLLSLPLVAGAQAIRCKDAAGRVVYTDQPCAGGQVVVPARTDAERLADEQSAEQARARAADRQQQAQSDQRARDDAARQDAANRAAAAAAVPPSQTPQCQQAMAEADFRSRSNTATPEQIRTARYNAALACGQQPPADVVVVQPEPWGVVPPAHRPPHGHPGGWGQGNSGYPQRPVEPQRPRPSYSGGTQDNRAIPVAPARPAATQTRPSTSSSGIATPRGSSAGRPDDQP